jgi:predicted GH43/DUF377 family glycosyl hydrolase
MGFWEKQGVVFCPSGEFDWMQTHAAVPTADLIGGDEYRVYFGCRDASNRARIGFVDIDLKEPKRILGISKQPVVEIGALGTFDDSGALMSWVTTVGRRKMLYYVGWNLGVTVPFRNSVGLAISEDAGRTFRRYSEAPIMDRGPHDPSFATNPCVLCEGDRWRMYYLSCFRWELEDGKPKHYYHIKYAESEDGIHWRRDGKVSIDFRSDAEYAISRPCTLREGSRYRMWFSYRGSELGPTYRIGYAESEDGVSFQRKDGQVGIDISESGWDSEMIEYPFVFRHQDNLYMLYNGNGYGRTGFGLAVWRK